MSNFTFIYDKTTLKLIDALNYTLEEFNVNPQGCYPNWNEEKYLAIENKIEDPILDKNSQTLREKTREEKILLDNKVELLQDGEYIQDGKIVTVPCVENFLKKSWNKEKHIWEEGATVDEIIEQRKNKILKYSELEKEKKALEGSKFSTEDEILTVTEEMNKLEKEINSLANIIATLK